MSVVEAIDILSHKDAYPADIVESAKYTLGNAADLDPL